MFVVDKNSVRILTSLTVTEHRKVDRPLILNSFHFFLSLYTQYSFSTIVTIQTSGMLSHYLSYAWMNSHVPCTLRRELYLTKMNSMCQTQRCFRIKNLFDPIQLRCTVTTDPELRTHPVDWRGTIHLESRHSFKSPPPDSRTSLISRIWNFWIYIDRTLAYSNLFIALIAFNGDQYFRKIHPPSFPTHF